MTEEEQFKKFWEALAEIQKTNDQLVKYLIKELIKSRIKNAKSATTRFVFLINACTHSLFFIFIAVALDTGHFGHEVIVSLEG